MFQVMHHEHIYTASICIARSTLLERNPRREALLLAKWREGKTAREAALETGVPEGSTYYYWRKFNKDPERANRLAGSFRPPANLRPIDILTQTLGRRSKEEVFSEYNRLMKEGKYVQAKSMIEAQQAFDKYVKSANAELTSWIALYMAKPEKYGHVIPNFVREYVQVKMNGGVTFATALEETKAEFAALSGLLQAGHGALMMTELLRLKESDITGGQQQTNENVGDAAGGAKAERRKVVSLDELTPSFFREAEEAELDELFKAVGPKRPGRSHA